MNAIHHKSPYLSMLFVLFFLGFSLFTKAQVYPVQVIPQINPPYNVTLPSYTTTTSDKINVRLILTDIGANVDVRLKMIIKGQGLNIQSTDFVVGAAPINLTGGTPELISTIDLQPYFRLQNLVGIPPQVYNRALPAGRYDFCFQVWTTNTQNPQLVSNPNGGCAFAFLVLNDPPILIKPQRGDQIVLKDPLNIFFNWQSRSTTATNLFYEFEIRELWDDQLDPQAAFLASPPLYRETTRANAFLYDNTKPALLPDKTYAWRVRAISTSGIDENAVYKNNGYSEIFHFRLTKDCDAPKFPLSEAISKSTVKINWQGNLEHNKYHVQYRKVSYTQETDKQRARREKKNKKRAKKGQKEKDYVPKKEDHDWFEVYTFNEQAQISNLEAGVTYEFRVGGTCSSLASLNHYYSYTSENQFTMPTDEETVSYNCGVVPDIQITNQTPLQNLGVNETFYAGDFPVTVKEIQNNGGRFSGNGFIVVPYLADTKLAVAFEGITINTDYQLIDGVVKTTYDPNWGGVESVDEFINDIVDLISDLFDTNDAVNDVYSDGKIDEDEIEILAESQESYADAIEELENISPRTEEQQELLDALQENNENISEVIEDAENGNNTISQNDSASQSQETVNNLTKVTIYFNDELQEYEVSNNASFPTISGVPIKLPSFEKLGINDYGGLGWFVINGEKYLGCFTESKFRGYYPKTFIDNIKEQQGTAILATKENLDAFNAAEYKGYSIAQIGEQAFTVAKRVEGDGATLDCICEYRWIVEDVETTVQLSVKDRIPPQNATRSNCEGTVCNTTIVAGALGSNAFDAITEAYPEIASDTEKLAKLEELKNYLDDLTADKTFALYNTTELRDIGQNSLSSYRRYFKDNNIYSKELFLEHFPESTYARGVDIIFSKVDLRKDLNPNYNVNSLDYLRSDRYYYDFADLTTRHLVLFDIDPSSIGTEILRLEEEGIANAISGHNGYEQYVAKWGTDDAWMFIAQWAAIYAQDIVEGYGGAVVATKVSRLFGKAVKTPSLWKKFLAIFKKPQKIKNKAVSRLGNNVRAKNLVDELADNPAFQGTYDDAGFKFKLPDETGDGFVDVIEVGYDGRVLIKDQSSIQNLLDEFNEIKIDFAEGTNIRYGNQSYTNGRLEVDNEGVVKFINNEKLWTSIDELYPVNFKGNPNATYYDVNVTYQANRPRAGVALKQDDILELHLNIPEELQGQGIGTEIFKEAIDGYTPLKVKGWWKESDIYTGGESVNLIIFKQKLDEGLSPIEAALETPSGKIFERNGFGGTPEIIKNTPEEVIIHFNSSN